MKTTENTYEIPKHNYPALLERLAVLNRRAAKLKCSEVGVRIIREFEVERKNPNTKATFKVAYLEVEPYGESPRLDGWRLIACIEPLESGENLVRVVPGAECPIKYRDTDTSCDHCKTDRRRKEVFVLRHEDGRFVQVGRTCIADFLGHVSVENIVAQAEWRMEMNDLLNEAGGEGFGSPHGERLVPINEYLATIAIVIRRLGWISNTKAREESTEFRPLRSSSSIAWQICTCHDRFTRELIEECNLHAENRDLTLAQETLEWARVQEGSSDYLYNLGVACRLDYVKLRTSGIVGSAIAAYLRYCERVDELRNESRKNKDRKHLGVVGERVGFAQVEIKKLHCMDGQYGVRTLVKFETIEGNILIWWSSKEIKWGVGDKVDITGTIHKHSEYNGCPQTELKRVAEGLPKVRREKEKV
jgi:hypothetical protein